MDYVLTITGPSACGKSTLEKFLCELPQFYRVISVTTRPPRQGEINGQHYYFVSDEEFDAFEKNAQFFENVEFSGYRYGGLISEFNNAWAMSKVPVVVCEPVGMKQISKWCSEKDVPHLAVYFKGQDYIVNRFVTRLDAMANKDNMPAIKVLSRMASFVTEMTKWESILEAHLGSANTIRRGTSSIAIDTFDSPHDLMQVVNAICRQIERG